MGPRRFSPDDDRGFETMKWRTLTDTGAHLDKRSVSLLDRFNPEPLDGSLTRLCG